MALEGIQGIPNILDFDTESNEHPYFTMPMLGKDLSFILKKCGGKFTSKTVLMLALQLIGIFQQIHEKGYLHRDLKPENILLGVGVNRNKVFLVDFGTSKSYKYSNSNSNS